MSGPNPRLPDTTLPIMPVTGRELRRLLDLASTRHPQLQSVLLADPGASVAVFRELDRIRPGSSEQVGDAAHAVSLLGVDAFRRLIDRLPEVTTDNPRSGLCSAYSEGAHSAVFAASLARHSGLPRHAELCTAALLQHPAVLALATRDADAVQRAVYAVRDGVPVDVAFGAELGEPLQDADQRIATAWALPALARQALGDWDDFNPRPQVVKLANQIAETTAIGWHGEHFKTLNAVVADYLGIDDDQAETWLHCQAVEAAHRLGNHAYPLPGFELMLIPGDDDGDDDDIPPMRSRPRPEPEPPPEPARPAPGQALTATMGAFMKRISREAGARRVVFAMLNPGRSRLRTRLVLGAGAEDGFRRLELELAQKNLFSALMGKPQSLWLNPANASRYQAFLPGPLERLIGPQGAYLMSLFVGDRPLGLMYADGPEISEQGYRRFRELCSEATRVLTAGSREPAQADT